MSNEELRERVTDLEVKLAYQEHTVVALDEVVRELAARVASLEAELGLMRVLTAPTVSSTAPSE